jgi:hypothetical protein
MYPPATRPVLQHLPLLPRLPLPQLRGHEPRHDRRRVDTRPGIQEERPGPAGEDVLDRPCHLVADGPDHLDAAVGEPRVEGASAGPGRRVR